MRIPRMSPELKRRYVDSWIRGRWWDTVPASYFVFMAIHTGRHDGLFGFTIFMACVTVGWLVFAWALTFRHRNGKAR
jgi:hypothetical protein